MQATEKIIERFFSANLGQMSVSILSSVLNCNRVVEEGALHERKGEKIKVGYF